MAAFEARVNREKTSTQAAQERLCRIHNWMVSLQCNSGGNGTCLYVASIILHAMALEHAYTKQ